MDNINKELFDRNCIDEKQYRFLEAIRTNKIVSVYYELRMVLYLGIMLFTGGVGYFAYQNMGDIGHLLSMTLIAAAIAVGFYFIRKYTKPYSNLPVTVDLVYFDYILILVASLIISLFAYIQVYFGLVEMLLSWTSFISAFILFIMSYRYDNRALLSMGIAALAAAVGLSITPIDWVKAEWSVTHGLYATSILFGVLLISVGEITYRYGIKKHFRFTYQNFGLLLYYVGCIAAMFDSNMELFYASLLLISAIGLTIYTWKMKEFLFFLYSNIAGYITITYLLFKMVDSMRGDYVLFVYYFPVTCIGYIIFLVNKKSHFAHD
jgi:hypothetical protein